MKYAAVVFRNITTSAGAVHYGAVADALLSGGIQLDEIDLLPYDNPRAVIVTLTRLAKECDGVFVICDHVLLPAAREAIAAVTRKIYDGECLLETESCLFAVLPADGRGEELAKTQVVSKVDEKRSQSYHSVVIRTVNAPAAKMLMAVAHAQDEAGDKLTIHTSEEFGVGRIEVIYDRNTPKVVADEVVRILASELKQYVYALKDISIAEQLFEALKLHRYKIATAESFTGGGVGQAIVSIPGASKVFYEGLNTYDSASKMARLGVTEYTLRNKGAVSSETAYEMAAGLLKDGHCDVAVATTGIAGPDSDGSGVPAGQCYIAIGTKEKVRVYDYKLEGDRETVTKKAINLALFLTYTEIN